MKRIFLITSLFFLFSFSASASTVISFYTIPNFGFPLKDAEARLANSDRWKHMELKVIGLNSRQNLLYLKSKNGSTCSVAVETAELNGETFVSLEMEAAINMESKTVHSLDYRISCVD